MEKNNEFCVYGGFNEEVFGLDDYEDQYYAAPHATSNSGCYGTEFVYNSEYDVQNLQVSFPVISVPHGGATYFYYPHVVSLPVYFYVPVYITYQDPVGYEEPCAIEEISNGFSRDIYNYDDADPPEEYRSIYDKHDSFQGTLSEGLTTCHLSYEEKPGKLSDAAPDYKDDSVTADKKPEVDKVFNGSDVDERTVLNQLNEEDYNVDINIGEEDIDENVIKEVSLLSIDDIKEDDENYEDGKSFLYQQALKGYVENKNKLEELDWECHILEDIPEEEEPECSHVDVSVVKKGVCQWSKENLHSESVNYIKEHPPPVNLSSVDEKDKTSSFIELSLSKENLDSGSLNSIEEHPLPVNSSVPEEHRKMNSVLQLPSREEEFDYGSGSSTEELNTNMTSQEDVGERKAASKKVKRKKRFASLRKFFARMCCFVKKKS